MSDHPPAARVPSGWQEIATGPKAQRVLVHVKPRPHETEGEITFGWFHKYAAGGGIWLRDETGEAIEATHWMPLPAHPGATQEPPATFPDHIKADGSGVWIKRESAPPGATTEEPDDTCDNDVGRPCRELWPQSRTSWCEGCLNWLVLQAVAPPGAEEPAHD